MTGTLFGLPIDRRSLLARVGDLRQVADVTPLRLADGAAEGIEAVHCRTGSGFAYTVLPGRALDIGWAEYRGVPLCWLSPTGYVAAPFFDPDGRRWLRTFAGGLFATCGLSAVGQPSRDGGEEFGLHGRISGLPASRVYADGRWIDDQRYEMWVRGEVRETSALGTNLVLTRTIRSWLGESRVMIDDVVENCAATAAVHMFRYHFNLGYPLLAAEARLHVQAGSVESRDSDATAGWDHLSAPLPPTAEDVFYIDAGAGVDGWVSVALVNPAVGDRGPLGLSIRYRRAELPILVLWKQLSAGTYVLGIEPSNCRDEGRASERERGTLRHLEPGERISYALEVAVLERDEVERILRGDIASATRED